MNLFLHELKAYRKSTITWTLAIIGSAVLFFSMFPSVSKEAEEFKKIIQSYPEALRLALGLSVENIGSILGFYAYFFLYILLIGAIQAMNLGTAIISKEVRDKTADFLLTKPVTRIKIMTAKLLASFTSLLITNIFYLTAAFIMASLVETKAYSLKTFFLLSVTLFFIQLIFLALGIIVSVIIPKIKSVLPISLGTVIGFFVIGSLASATGDSALRYFTPFQYFNFAYIMQNAKYESSYLVAAICFVAAAVIASYYIYLKRDIHAV